MTAMLAWPAAAQIGKQVAVQAGTPEDIEEDQLNQAIEELRAAWQHLGLVPPDEMSGLEDMLDSLATQLVIDRPAWAAMRAVSVAASDNPAVMRRPPGKPDRSWIANSLRTPVFCRPP